MNMNVENVESNQIPSSHYIKWAICIIIPLLIPLLPDTQLFTPVLQRFLACTVFGILLLLFDIIAAPIAMILLTASYVIFNVVPWNVALGPWANPVIFAVIALVALMEAIKETPFFNRLAYKIMSMFGDSWFGVVTSMLLICLVLAILIPTAVNGLVAIFIAAGFVQALGIRKFSPAAAGIMLLSGIGCFLFNHAFYSNLGIGFIATSAATVIKDFNIGYVEMIFDNLPSILWVFLIGWVFSKVFKPDTELPGKEVFKEKLAELGPMQGAEKRVAVILGLMVIYLASTQFTKLDLTYGFFIAAAAMYVPFLGIATKDTFSRVSPAPAMIGAGCLAIGVVATTVGVGPLIINIFQPFMENTNIFSFVSLVAIAGTAANFLMTPLALYGLITPPFTELAVAMNIDPKIVVYTIEQSGNFLFFPYEATGPLIAYSLGLFTMKDGMKGCIIITILGFIWLLGIMIPWWKLLGIA